jgi:4'-phosphopantetheinyl transferase EntD
VGSITHTQGCAAAVVANSEHSAGLGLDVELLNRQLSPALANKVCSPLEREDLERQREPGSPLLRLLSAKEAIFKCCYPLAGVYLGFLDAECRIVNGGFEVKLLKAVHRSIPVAFELRVLQTVAFGYLFSACELCRSDLSSC